MAIEFKLAITFAVLFMLFWAAWSIALGNDKAAEDYTPFDRTLGIWLNLSAMVCGLLFVLSLLVALWRLA